MNNKKKKKIKKWIGGEEHELCEQGICWVPTGKHICNFISDDSLGEDNKGRCMICGEYKKVDGEIII